MTVHLLELVGAATVVKMAVSQHHVQRLLSVRPQSGDLQEPRQVVNSHSSVNKQV